MCLKITDLRLQPHLPGTNEFPLSLPLTCSLSSPFLSAGVAGGYAAVRRSMGKCLSCCHTQDTAPTHNGHPASAQPPKVASVLSSSPGVVQNPTHGSLELRNLPPTPGNDPVKPASNGDQRKMFSAYPKLPPIRRTSAEGKRMLTPSRDFSEAKVAALFENYVDGGEEAILAEGIERLCADLDVRPEEFRVLVLAWKMDAQTMCRFTREEFTGGLRSLKADSLRGIQAKFPEMLAEVQQKGRFKDFYRWTYKFGLDTDIGQRTLPIDMALSLWKLVFSQNEPPILKRWLSFLEWHPNIRGIPKDTWDMFLNFCEAVGNDLSSYDDTEAWPSLFDDFVEYENDRENQNVQIDKQPKDDCDDFS